ncbi:MAG: hypothetical protein Q9164_004586, partial [Protoblastenia rupestris]
LPLKVTNQHAVSNTELGLASGTRDFDECFLRVAYKPFRESNRTSDPPPKRPRVDSPDSISTPSTITSLDDNQIAALVRSLKPKTTIDLFITAAQTHPVVAQIVQDKANRLADLEKQTVINFDYLSKSAWKTLTICTGTLRRKSKNVLPS